MVYGIVNWQCKMYRIGNIRMIGKISTNSHYQYLYCLFYTSTWYWVCQDPFDIHCYRQMFDPNLKVKLQVHKSYMLFMASLMVV